MYRCESCNKVSEPKEPLNLVPVEFRSREYHSAPDSKGQKYFEGRGKEIVREKKLCRMCADSSS
jgi:hypothetical protein